MTPFQAAAVSSWNAAQQTATISVVYSACAASSQPVWAKMMDYFGRPFVVYASFLFYVLGCIIMAVSQNVETMCGGRAIYVFGYGAQNRRLNGEAETDTSVPVCYHRRRHESAPPCSVLVPGVSSAECERAWTD